MVRAKEMLEAEDYQVIGGEIAITRQQHIARKGAPVVHDNVRLHLIELACADQNWLRGVDGSRYGSAAQYIKGERMRWRRVYGESIMGISVEGSDVLLRYPPRNNEIELVIVAREGEAEAAALAMHQAQASVGLRAHLLAPEPSHASASSTAVREALLRRDGAVLARMCGHAVATALWAMELSEVYVSPPVPLNAPPPPVPVPLLLPMPAQQLIQGVQAGSTSLAPAVTLPSPVALSARPLAAPLVDLTQEDAGATSTSAPPGPLIPPPGQHPASPPGASGFSTAMGAMAIGSEQFGPLSSMAEPTSSTSDPFPMTAALLLQRWRLLTQPCHVIGFYGHLVGTYASFSNFHQHEPVSFAIPESCGAAALRASGRRSDGLHFEFSEKAIMLCKAAAMRDFATFDRIAYCTRPSDAKSLGRQVTPYDASLWAQLVCTVARHVVLTKFESLPPLTELLIGTGKAMIAEATRNDRIWGIVCHQQILTHLALTKLRNPAV